MIHLYDIYHLSVVEVLPDRRFSETKLGGSLQLTKPKFMVRQSGLAA